MPRGGGCSRRSRLSWNGLLLRRLFGFAGLFQTDGVEVVAHVVALRRRNLLLLEGVHRLLGVRALDVRVLGGGLALGRLALHEVRADVRSLAQLGFHLGLLGVEVGRRLGTLAVALTLAQTISGDLSFFFVFAATAAQAVAFSALSFAFSAARFAVLLL